MRGSIALTSILTEDGNWLADFCPSDLGFEAQQRVDLDYANIFGTRKIHIQLAAPIRMGFSTSCWRI